MRFEHLTIAGVYFPPLIGDLVIAGIALLLVHLLFVRLRLHRFVWHPALVEIALFLCALSGTVLLLNP